MAEETLEQFLERRERELANRLTALQAQAWTIEAELLRVRHTRKMLGESTLTEATKPKTAAAETVNPMLAAIADEMAKAGATLGEAMEKTMGAMIGSPTSTIKDMVIQALIDAYPNGAMAGQIRDFIRSGYEREVDQASLRTQLHRLKAAGILGQAPRSNLWDFRDPQQRAYYSKYRPARLQDDPTPAAGTSRAMPMIVDEVAQSIEDNQFLKRAAELAWRDEDDKK